jgi:hypothetical protein
MQISGRILVSSARHTVFRLSRSTGANGVRRLHSRPPPSLFVNTTALQRRGYRRTSLNLKDDDDKRHKSGKDMEKQIPAEESEKKVDSLANDQDAKIVEKTVDSTKESKSGGSESPGSKEKRTKESKNKNIPDEAVRPAVISRNQALSLVANNGGKSRLIITNHDHPETYPQCMALAMSGRPILPGFYSILFIDAAYSRVDICQERSGYRGHP